MENDFKEKLVLARMEEAKAKDVSIYKMPELNPIAGFVILCTATSKAHAKGILERIASIKDELKEKPLGIEGKANSDWILIDYNDIIIHIFNEELRQLYRIDEYMKQLSQDQEIRS